MVKLQSNALTPELDKVLADSRLIREISAIYREVRKKDIPGNMILPLRDLYTVINYNPFMLAAILKDKKYEVFEQDVGRTTDLDKKQTLDLFAKTFDQTKIAEEAARIANSPEAASIVALALTNNNPQVVATRSATGAASTNPYVQPSSVNGQPICTVGDANPNTLSPEEQAALKNVLQVLGAAPSDKEACPVEKKDTCMTPMANRIQENASKLFDIHDAARRLEPTHKGDMVLRPEFAWSVPQRRAPICTTIGQKQLTQPVMESSKLLLGTPLDDAKDTQVGSIMPKFEYKEYVDVPVVPKNTTN
jgi:hypothetical protein